MSLVRRSFQQYYSRLGGLSIPGLPNREFGFIFLEGTGMVRHRQFLTADSLRNFLRSSVPLHVYYSCALYRNPAAEMKDKGLIGADLVFDIDADHLETPCNKAHDVWQCSKCGATGKGRAPETCTQCGSGKILSRTWICEECLGAAKEHTVRLLDILRDDLGIPKGEISVFFSGHRGYHVHVTGEDVRSLGSDERREIVDYVSASGINLQYHGFQEAIALSPPFGWNLRIIRGIRRTIEANGVEGLTAMGLRRKVAEVIVQNKERLMAAIGPDRPWPFLRGVGVESWRKIAAHAVSEQSATVDSVVTIDMHRLIRMPWSLHGKTGLVVAPVENLESFDPLVDAVAFKEGFEKVHVVNPQPVMFLGSRYAPTPNSDAVLPTGLALLYLLKGNAVEVGR